MLRYEELSQKPELFARLVGLKYNYFLVLVSRASRLWGDAEQARLGQKPRKRAIGGGRKYKLESMETKMFLMLMFYRHYVTHELIGLMFDLDASNVTRLINKLSPIFEQAADPKLKTYLEEAKRCSKKIASEYDFFTEYPELKIVSNDATEQRIQRSRDPEKRRRSYSGKKKCFANKTQITVAENTRIIDISLTYPGSVHDKKIMDREKTTQKIPQQSLQLDDLGYYGVPKENPGYRVFTPRKRRPKQKKLPTNDIEFNKLHAKKRITVEHGFCKIKKFKICSEIYRGKEKNYNQTFRNIAALVNLNYCST